jgi:O-antigen biosynthesis protein
MGDKKDRVLSIIMPVYNQWEYTELAIKSIVKNTQIAFELIVIDNGSSDDTGENLKKITIESKNWEVGVFRPIYKKENTGFPKAVNDGLRRAKGKYLCIINNDVVVSKYCFERMVDHLNNGLDLVGVCTNSVAGPQQKLVKVYDGIEGFEKRAEEFYLENKGQFSLYHIIIFFCVMIKKEVFDKIGILDEVYTPGNYEDDDFCLRAIESGFKCGVAKDIFVHHFRSVTMQEKEFEYEKLLKRNRKIFVGKWGPKIKDLAEKNGGNYSVNY